jgi:hypothetical protein
MSKSLRHCLSFCLLSIFLSPEVFAQSPQISSLTAISNPDSLVAVPIFAISRTANVVTVSTVDPGNPDQYAQQTNQVGVNVTIAGVSVDPSNAVNGTFPICGPPTPGCVAPTTSNWSFISPGQNFSASSSSQLGLSGVARMACPLLPTGYFSFCGDSKTGAGLTSQTDGSLIEVVTTQDSVGAMLWASSLGDGNSGSARVTGCEQMFIESGNEWRLQCDHQRWNGGSIDIDTKNDLMTLGVGDGLSSFGTGAEFILSGTRNIASFGVLGNHTLFVDTGANPSGSVMPNTGILRMRNGSTVCWENVSGTASLCQSTDANDRFSFNNGVVTPTYATSTVCSSTGGQCGSAAAGSVAFPVNSTSLVVFTSAVTPQSQIFVQEDSSLGVQLAISCNSSVGRVYQVTQRLAGVSFEIRSSAPPLSNPACLSYHIVN